MLCMPTLVLFRPTWGISSSGSFRCTSSFGYYFDGTIHLLYLSYAFDLYKSVVRHGYRLVIFPSSGRFRRSFCMSNTVSIILSNVYTRPCAPHIHYAFLLPFRSIYRRLCKWPLFTRICSCGIFLISISSITPSAHIWKHLL